CVPQLFFRNKIVYKTFVVYSPAPLHNNIYKVLDKAELLLSKTPERKSFTQRIYILNSFGLFTYFAPMHFKAFAVNQQFTGHILIANANIKKNLALRNEQKN